MSILSKIRQVINPKVVYLLYVIAASNNNNNNIFCCPKGRSFSVGLLVFFSSFSLYCLV